MRRRPHGARPCCDFIHPQPARAFFCAGRSASALFPAPFAPNPDGPCPMRTLSLAVALFALAAVLVGLRAPDVGLFLYAAAALLCAGATYRSAHISTFLRVFEVVFAVETIVFGAAYLVDELGLWPQRLRRLRAAELAAAHRRAVRLAGLRRLAHPGRAQDDRHRRPLFLRAGADDGAHLAGASVHGRRRTSWRSPRSSSSSSSTSSKWRCWCGSTTSAATSTTRCRTRTRRRSGPSCC